MQLDRQTKWSFSALGVVLILFFTMLYFADNKYESSPPYGRDGVISITEENLSYKKEVFLISGWLFSDERVKNQPTYIGEYKNLQRGDHTISPHGTTVYTQILSYSGKEKQVSLYFPELYHQYKISLNNQIVASGSGDAVITFVLTTGNHKLEVETFSKIGYYSGMYYPPVLCDVETLMFTTTIQNIAYAVAFFIPLVLAIFTLPLWGKSEDKVSFWFGLLCCCFSLYVSYYFIRFFHAPFAPYWFFIQSIALYGLCFCVIRLTIMVGDVYHKKPVIWIQCGLLVISIGLVLLSLCTTRISFAVQLHALVTNIYFICVFCSLLYLVIQPNPQQKKEYQLTLFGCFVFGVGILLNLFMSNLFEPILFFWQFEWCGIFLVWIFAWMMMARNKRIIQENMEFSSHLEVLVEQRTQELSNLLEERKAFFADMTHDLKAPIFATKSFIHKIRKNNTGIDAELMKYIDQVDFKQQEMSQRIQGLATYNKFESIIERNMLICVDDLLKEIYSAHHMAAEVASIHLKVLPLEENKYIFAQPRKLSILFENLIFNALRATPENGEIIISAEIDGDTCQFTVADTGKGISMEELPHIFERFFVGEENKRTGSGLGLYIAKGIVEEISGEIYVSSKPERGTVFRIGIPLHSAI